MKAVRKRSAPEGGHVFPHVANLLKILKKEELSEALGSALAALQPEESFLPPLAGLPCASSNNKKDIAHAFDEFEDSDEEEAIKPEDLSHAAACIARVSVEMVTDRFKFSPAVLELLGRISKPSQAADGSKVSSKAGLFAYRDRSEVSTGNSIAVEAWLKCINNNSELDGALQSLSIALRGCRTTAEPKDGNCFFHALRRQLKGEHTAGNLRRRLVAEIGEHTANYKDFLPMPVEDYKRHIGSNGQWAGEIDVRAMANALGRPICIVVCLSAQQAVSSRGTWRTASQVMVHRPTRGESRDRDCLFVHYNGRSHYQSIVPGSGVSREAVLHRLEALNQPAPASASSQGSKP